MVAAGHLVFVHGACAGTDTGKGFLGFPSTGNKMEYGVVDMFRLRDGKPCEHWDMADAEAIFIQIGAIKA